MRKTLTTAIAITCIALTAGCAGSDDKADSKPATSKTSSPSKTASPSPKVDCSDTSLDQATWMKYCSKDGGNSQGEQTLTWGKTARTVGAQSPATGAQGGGPLEVTPTTVLYAKSAMGNTSANGTYAIITVKDRAYGRIAATESAPIEGGGWQWIAPDGQALDEGENDASSITPDGFTGGGMVKAGTYQWKTIAFDLAPAQAKGGTIAYTDGNGVVYEWKVPTTDSGPELSALKKGMEGY
jgi:hypothetical protein